MCAASEHAMKSKGLYDKTIVTSYKKIHLFVSVSIVTCTHESTDGNKLVIGMSLSEPHTSGTALCVYTYCQAHQCEALNEGSILAMYMHTYISVLARPF